jgi:hypothetical protein
VVPTGPKGDTTPLCHWRLDYLDDVAREEAELRQRLAAIDAQKAVAEAYEAHITGASLLLYQLQDGLAEIDRTNDLTKKR